MNHAHCFLALALFFTGCTSTPITADLDQSEKEIESSFSFVSQDGDTFLEATGTYLYHISPTTQIGPIAGYQSTELDGFSVDLFQGGVEIRENFSTSGEVLPFVGTSLSFLRASSDLTDTNLSGNAIQLFTGIRTPLSDNAFLVSKLNYTNVSVNDDSQDNISVTAGISVRY